MLFGGTGWDIGLLTFNQGVTGSRPTPATKQRMRGTFLASLFASRPLFIVWSLWASLGARSQYTIPPEGIDKIIYPLFTGYSPTCLPFLPEYLPYLVRLLPEDIRERGPRNEKGVLFLR
jgi:hypothetical protein